MNSTQNAPFSHFCSNTPTKTTICIRSWLKWWMKVLTSNKREARQIVVSQCQVSMFFIRFIGQRNRFIVKEKKIILLYSQRISFITLIRNGPSIQIVSKNLKALKKWRKICLRTMKKREILSKINFKF